MLSRKIILTMVIAISLLILAGDAMASRVVVRMHSGRGVRIAREIGPGFQRIHRHRESINFSRSYRRVIVTRPYYRRFIRIGPPRAEVVVVEKPRLKHFEINLSPTITISRPTRVTEPTTVTVWITNSNGSQTSVTLTKSGPGYKGPRGEWYPNMPTEEQLSMVYGF